MTGPAVDGVRTAYLDRLGAADERGAVRVAVDALDGGVDPEVVLLDVVAAAQRAVGDHWATGEWSVVQEHVATHISDRVVAAIARHAPPPRPTGIGSVVVACLDGEWHGLPARLLAEVLERHGWRVEFLGTSVPAAQLAAHLRRGGPDVVAVSSSLPSRLPAARRMVEACHAADTRVLAGGPAFGADGRWARAVGADGWAPDARSAVALLAHVADGPWYPADAGWPRGSPVDDAAREEQALLHARRGQLIALVAAALRRGDLPDELTDGLGHLVDFLAASVFVDDATLLEGFVRWVGAVAIPGGLVTDEVARALDVLGVALGDFPRAMAILRATRAGLPAADRTVRAP